MSWSVGMDDHRWVGYGVPAICDHPECDVKIDRGLAFRCGEFGDDESGCGLFFCGQHGGGDICGPCQRGDLPYHPKPDCEEWVQHMLTDESWARWRAENPEQVAAMGGAQ